MTGVPAASGGRMTAGKTVTTRTPGGSSVRGNALLRDERWARVALSRIAEPGTVCVARWVAEHGAVETVHRLAAGELDTESRYAARLAALDIEAARRAGDVCGVRVLVPGDDSWPDSLDELSVPPLCLYVLGDSGAVADLLAGSIAVVGSRAATEYGRECAAGIAAGLARRSVTVVSGLAYGIDAAAHRGALSEGAPTVAVLACGLDRVYPTGHTRLHAEILQTGLVLSEVPIGSAPYRTRFLARNRLIAAMTVGTVVVEASLRSGSLNTARHARDLNRHVAALPGPVTSMSSAGCHDLIRTKGAGLVTDAAEVLDLMGRLGLDLADSPRAPAQADDDLDPRARTVWSAVPVRKAVDVDELALTTGLPAGGLLAILGFLEMAGLVVREGGGWRKARPARR
jgi:DNA processing protein